MTSISDQAARNSRICADRTRGLSWPKVAERNKISERRAQEIFDAWKETKPSVKGLDPIKVVEDMLTKYESAQEYLAEIAENAVKDSDRIGATRERLKAMVQYTELLQAVGVLPKHLGKLRIEMDMRQTAFTIIEVLQQNQVPQQVQRQIIETLERGREVKALEPTADADE